MKTLFFATFFIFVFCIHVGAGPFLLNQPHQLVSKDRFMWNREEIWTVSVTPETEYYFPEESGGNYGFDDLEPDMRVTVFGRKYEGELHITATEVSAYYNYGYSARFGHNCGSIEGIIQEIDYESQVFSVLVNGYQNTEVPVLVGGDATMLEAFQGSPIVPLDFEDFREGDPVMIRGTWSGDGVDAIAVVRSFDWDPDIGREYGDTVEVYGWISVIFHSPQFRGFLVYISAMSGDPNHQNFSAYITPEGGNLEFPWGHLSFPPGALDHGEEIIVSGDFMFWETLTNRYFFDPTGLTFNQPVEIEIRYFNLEGIDPEHINLSYYDEATGRWRLATHMVHFPEEHCFRGYIEHFSRYSLSTNGRPLREYEIQE